MKMLTVCLTMALAVSTAFCADTGAKRKLTPEELAARRAAAQLRKNEKTGGMVEQPGAQKGKFLVLNAQREVSSDAYRNQISMLAQHTKFNLGCEDIESFDGNAIALKGKKDAAGVLVLVYDEKTPSLLVSPDEQWAVVNVKSLELKLNAAGKKRFLPSRTAKQVCRALSILSGSTSQFKGAPGQATGIDQLDDCGDMIPMDQVMQLGRYLEANGMSRKRIVTYRKACQEGWATQPTNKFQKAIWDEVHELPTKPLKLEK